MWDILEKIQFRGGSPRVGRRRNAQAMSGVSRPTVLGH